MNKFVVRTRFERANYSATSPFNEPLAVPIDQIVLLGGDNGYMVEYEGNVLHTYSKSNFPLSKKTSVVSRSYGMLSGTLTYGFYPQGGKRPILVRSFA